MLTVRLFASLREMLDTAELQLAWSDELGSVACLVDLLARDHGPAWRERLCAPGIVVAINREVVERDTALRDGDEVAFLPPVSGG